jgi:predicted ATP-dependent endonuclease of OLD family
VQEFVSAFPLEPKVALELDVSIVERGFSDALSEFIAFNRAGEFYGPEGMKKIKNRVAATDFNNQDELVGFVNEFFDSLKAGKTDEANERSIDTQLKKGKDRKEIYNYLTGLSYLTPTYRLTWEGVPLNQLSPGERGTVLLVFYLLVDKEDIPLIIDQPEENLDNETVYKVLHNCIKYAKNRRQIIIVTHNPNLAVVCDSEQIIYAEIDKTNGNKISYLCGSVEDPEINALLVRILEGTRRAFQDRWSKYNFA